MTIDLRTCQTGQKLRLRDDSIVTYLTEQKTWGTYSHVAQASSGIRYTFTAEGNYYIQPQGHSLDVVEILPLVSNDPAWRSDNPPIPMATPYDIDNNFKFKPRSLNPTQSWHCEELRTSAASFAQDILDYAPDSRERSLALTRLEEAVFWANASIARNPQEEAE